MKIFAIVTALLVVLGTASAETDWKKIEDKLLIWQSQTKMIVSKIEKLVFSDNPTIGHKIKPTLHEYEAKALHEIVKAEGDAKAKTFTHDKLYDIFWEVHAIFDDLKEAIAGDCYKLSEEAKTHLKDVYNEGRNNIRDNYQSILEEIKE